MNLKTAKDHRKIWNNKPILKYIYKKWYDKITSKLIDKPNGISIEIGSGCANVKNFMPNTIATDIQVENWLDIVSDAQYLPYKDNSISSISLIDVLHHIPNPILFINESYRVLKKGGKIAIIEPYPTLISSIFYKFFHNEPLLKKQSLLNSKKYTSPNQATAYILFKKELKLFNLKYKYKLKINSKDLFSTILYPLSGGYKKFSFIPKFLIKPLELMENILNPFNRIFAFRVFIIIQKV